MKKNNFKKVAIASTAFMLSASLLSFGPVSYKVLPETNVAYAAASNDFKSDISNILRVVSEEPKLNTAFENARNEIANTIDVLSIQDSLPNLLVARTITASDTAALKAFLEEVMSYTQDTTNGFDRNVISELNTQFNVNVTEEDITSILLEVQSRIIETVKPQFNDPANLNIDLLSDLLLDALAEELDTQWDEVGNANSLVSGIKSIYGSANKTGFISDLSTLKAEVAANANSGILKRGTLALAIGYAKYYISENSTTAIEVSDVSQKKIINKVTVEGINIPLFILSWTDSNNNDIYNSTTMKPEFSYRGYSQSGTERVKGALGTTLFSTYGLDGVVLVDTELSYTVRPIVVDLPPIVTNPGTTVIVPTISSDAITNSPELQQLESSNPKSNAELAELRAKVSKLVEVSVKLVAPTNPEKTSDGKIKLSVKEDSFNDAFFENYGKNISEVKKHADGKLDIVPNLTLDARAYKDVVTEIDASLINKLVSIGVQTLTFVTEEGSVTVAISNTTTNLTLTVASKKAPENVSYDGPATVGYPVGMNYSFEFGFNLPENSIVNIRARNIVENLAFENGNSDGLHVAAASAVFAISNSINKTPTTFTFAKVEANNKLKLIASKYNADTKEFEAYITEPGTYVIVEVEVDFVDIDHMAWAADAIKTGAVQGIFEGRGNNEFKPKEGVTKAEYLTILLRTFNIVASKEAGKSVHFSDVNANNWYFNSVAAGIEFGIISDSNGKFEPNKVLTREEMADLTAALLVNTLGYKNDYPAVLELTADKHLISKNYVSSVQFVVNEGILIGKSKDTFDPQSPVTRAEAAVVALRLQNIK